MAILLDLLACGTLVLMVALPMIRASRSNRDAQRQLAARQAAGQEPQAAGAQQGAKRTIRDFSAADSIWPMVDEWAAQEGFSLKEPGAPRRLYRKSGAFTIPTMLDIQQQGTQVHLEAWAPKQFSPSPIYLLLPAESALDSAGFMMSEARRIGRTRINPLLEKLDQPLILIMAFIAKHQQSINDPRPALSKRPE